MFVVAIEPNGVVGWYLVGERRVIACCTEDARKYATREEAEAVVRSLREPMAPVRGAPYPAKPHAQVIEL